MNIKSLDGVRPENIIRLNKFKPRDFQFPLLDALENKNYKRLIAVWPRRSGKDISAWNLAIRQCLRKVCVVFYVFPTYAQGKKVLWDSVTNTGERILDHYVPQELVESKNSQEMKIRFKNGSMIQIVGSDNIDSLVGTNPYGVIFSEYALQMPDAFNFLRPILAANDGWAMFISTPRGKNHLYTLYQVAINNPQDWFVSKLTVEDTQHIPLEVIERERCEGLMSEDLIKQEYYTSFDMGQEGSVYGKYIDRMKINSQLGIVPWEPAFKVHVAIDIGVRDATTMLFFQCIGQTVRIIDCYSNNREGIEHYVSVINSKPYTYGKYIAPHDIRVQEFGSGITRFEKARQLGIVFTLSNDLSLADGIEAVKTTLAKIWVDDVKCKDFLKAIENYRREWDQRRGVYKDQPLHDWASHYADALRYMCVSLPKTQDSLSAKDLDKRHQEALYGTGSMPTFFRDDNRGY